MKDSALYPSRTPEMTKQRAQLAPEIAEAFRRFSNTVFQEGELSEKTKQLMAVAVAHVTQCPCCIRGHTRLANRQGPLTKRL